MDPRTKYLPFEGRQVPAPVQSYPYKKCTPGRDEIRLLKVLTSAKFDSVIRCSMEHFSLNVNNPEYAATSYEFGDPSKCRTILVDGVPFEVTINLFLFLRELRGRTCPLIWVDQICIDQNNDQEKSAHIARMGIIYHAAEFVYVWLGPASDGSHKIMSMLRDLENDRKPAHTRHREPAEVKDSDLEMYRTELQAFMRHGYWRRAWIIQETALGPRISVFCGSQRVSWEGIELLMARLGRRALFRGKSIDHVEHLCATRTEKLQDNPIGLLQALYESRASLSTDPRDRVYALLGLVFDRDKYVKSPRYDWSLTAICRRMTEEVIRSKRSLDIIFAGPKNLRSDLYLPSWCPDYFTFPSGPTMKHLSKYLSGQDERYRVGQSGRRWEATGGSPVTSRSFDFVGADGLELRGVRLGKVHSLGCVLNDDRKPRTESISGSRNADTDNRVIKAIDRTLSLYNGQYQVSGSQFSRRGPQIFHYLFTFETTNGLSNGAQEALRVEHTDIIEWRRLNEEFVVNEKTLIERSRDSRAIAYRGRWNDAIRDSFWPGWKAVKSWPFQYNPGERLIERLPPNLDSALTSLGDLLKEGLRLMSTSKGHVGWVHPNAEIGDQIYLLEGCSMPAILRPSRARKDTFTVVGHAFVDGVMSNEVWSKLEPSSKTTVRLV